MKIFVLNVGEILIDEIDKEIIYSSTWRLSQHLIRNKSRKLIWHKGYLVGSSGRFKNQFLHRVIAEKIGLDLSNEIDHKDLDTWNNQRENLRSATLSQNRANRPKLITNTSNYKGVSYRNGRWLASICVNYETITLGLFNTPEEAAEVYKKAARYYFGEFARF